MNLVRPEPPESGTGILPNIPGQCRSSPNKVYFSFRSVDFWDFCLWIHMNLVRPKPPESGTGILPNIPDQCRSSPNKVYFSFPFCGLV